MRKRMLIIGATILALVAAAVWFAAEESYVLQLDAKLGTALNVDKHGSVDFGHVYGQEVRTQRITVSLSAHALKDPNTTGVDYNVYCVPGEKDPAVVTLPDDKLAAADDLCQYVTGSPPLGPLDPDKQSTLGPFKLCTLAGQALGCTDTTSQVHEVKVTFPDCRGSVQPGSLKVINNNCTQDNSVALDGDIKVLRNGIQGDLKKLCDFDKEYTPAELEAFGCTD